MNIEGRTQQVRGALGGEWLQFATFEMMAELPALAVASCVIILTDSERTYVDHDNLLQVPYGKVLDRLFRARLASDVVQRPLADRIMAASGQKLLHTTRNSLRAVQLTPLPAVEVLINELRVSPTSVLSEVHMRLRADEKNHPLLPPS